MRSLILATTLLFANSAFAACPVSGSAQKIGPIQEVYLCEQFKGGSADVLGAEGCLFVADKGLAFVGTVERELYGALPVDEGFHSTWKWDKVSMSSEKYVGQRRREGTLTNPPEGTDLQFNVRSETATFVRYDRGLFRWKPFLNFQLQCKQIL